MAVGIVKQPGHCGEKNLMEWIITGGVVWILGAAVGSFLNVVIYRIPAGLSLLHPPSRCPKCYTGLKP
jgi:leader peptidase (prepilin peptidase)/N-methyltransferase